MSTTQQSSGRCQSADWTMTSGIRHAFVAAMILLVIAVQGGFLGRGANKARGDEARKPLRDEFSDTCGLVSEPLLQMDSQIAPVTAVTMDGARHRYNRLSEIEQPTKLRYVYAQSSRVENNDLKALSGAKYLRYLVLPGFGGSKAADIGDSGLERISQLHSLVYLSLGTETATDVGVAQIRRLTKLRMLELYATKATDAGVIAVGELPNLSDVTLYIPRMTDEGLAQFRALNRLWRLDVRGTSVAGVCFSRLARRNDLVLLSGNFTDEGLHAIGGAPWEWLTDIEVFGAQATAEGIAHLIEISSLHRVALHGTRVNNAAVREMQTAREDLRVEQD